MKNSFVWLFSLLFIFTGCSKYELEDEAVTGNGESMLTIRISPFEKSNFDVNPASRTVVSIDKVCTRIGFAVFDASGKKVASVNQDSKSAGFGTLTAGLDNGVYDIVVVAHSTGGNATISKPDSIRFTDNKVSDTFCYHEQINLKGSLTKEIVMKRCVGMVRLNINEPLPENVKQMKFEYSGGSSALNATTGFGRIQSRQTEYRTVAADAATAANNVFEIYTIPHEVNDLLKITITALASDGKTEIQKTVLEDVPVTQGMITNYHGTMFGGNSGGPADNSTPLSFTLKAEDSWTERTYNF